MACQIKKQNEKITEVLASNGATSILWDQLSGLTFLNDAQREDIYVNAQSIKNAVKDENGEPILMIQRTDVIHQNLGIGEVYTTDFTDAIMRNQGDTYSVGFIMSDNVEELETAEKTIPKQITDLFRKTTNSKAKVNKVKVNGIDNYVTTANVKNVFSINPNEDNTHAGFIIDKVRRGVLKLKTYQEKEKGLEAVQEDISDYPTEGDPQQQEDTSRINAYTVKTVWNKNRNIQFTGTTKVKNAEDVAEIMKQLENKTVEHAFAVHVDEKGDSYIQFLSIGGQTRTVIDPTLVLSGVTKFKTKKVYLVHNHPSGTLQPSQADLAITNKIREGLNPLKIDLEHVIIDTYKKSYVHIKSDNTFTVNKRGERELKDELEVYDITDKEFISEPMGKITQPDDVFKFIQNLRFSALPKKAVLLLDNGNNIIGNYILQKGVDLKEITDLIGEIGAVNGIILYGNYSDTVETNSLKGRLEKLDIRVLDDVTVGSNGNSVVEYYVSMNSRGLLSEHQEKYNTNEVNESFASDYNNQQLLAPRLSREAQEQTVTIQDIGVVNGKRVIAASLAGQRVGSLTLVEQDGNFVTDTISVSEGYRGLGIAGEMYLEAANVLDRPIMSDMYRTEEAEAVWDKLFLEGKARKTSNGRYLITKEVSEVEQTQSEITEFVHSQLEKAGLVDEYYLMTNEQIEAELKRRGYSDDIVRQVIAWHGSPYKFDKFTTDKIGAGEGAQAFGWGLYFTDLESIAEAYADNIGKGKLVEDFITESENSFRVQEEIRAFIPTSAKGEWLIENIENNYYEGFRESELKILRDFAEFKIKNNNNVQYNRNLYKVSLHKGKQPSEYNWLEWDKPVSRETLKKIFDNDIDGSIEEAFYNHYSEFYELETVDELIETITTLNIDGEFFYRILAANIGTEPTKKDASIALLNSGIDGIKYPAESIARGATSDTARGFNYVVFDENAITIEEQIQFSKTIYPTDQQITTRQQRTAKDVIAKGEQINKENEYLNCESFCVKMIDSKSFKDEFNKVDSKTFRIGKPFPLSKINELQNQLKAGDIIAFGEPTLPRHYAVYISGNEVYEVEQWGAKPRIFSLTDNLKYYESIAAVYRESESTPATRQQRIDKVYENSAFFYGGFFTAVQRQGFGKSIISDIFKNNPKIENILLYTQDDAIDFWKKVGGKVVQQGKDKGGTLRYFVQINKNDVDTNLSTEKLTKQIGSKVSYKNLETKKSKIAKGEYAINMGGQKIGFFFVKDVGTIKTNPMGIIIEDAEGIPQFQIIGEEGAANLDAQEEATYRLDNLQVAREMEQAGNTPKEIRIATGWERGADSKWRYEILDGKVLIQESGQYKLEDFYDSPELYKAYPQLKNIPVELNINDTGANNAWYNPNKKDIEINIKNESKYLLPSFLIHEIQHAVQFIELFDAGGNMEVAYQTFLENRTEEDIKKEEDLNKEIETLEKYRDIFEAFELGEYDDFLDGLTFEELFSLDFLKKSEFVNNELGDEGIKDVIKYLNNNPNFKEDMLNQFNEYEDFYFESMYAWSELLQKNKKKRSELYSPFGMYERLAGEVEARNVEDRMRMSEDKRRRTTLEETEDTPREDQLNLPSEKFLEFVTSQQEGNEDVAREDRKFLENAFRAEQSVKSPITVTTNGFYINENGLRKVYVNKDSNNVNGTNIHEYTHPYLEQLEKTNPEIYQKGEQLIEQELGKTKSEIQDIIDFVKRNQPNLQGRALINEILTQTIQQKGEEVINSKKKSNLKDWINEFLDWLKGKLGLTQYSNQEVLAMNLSEYSEAVAVDLLRGEELFTGNKAQEYYQRNADRLPLTLAVFERPEFVKMQGKMVKPITVLNSLNQSGIKQIEKELIRNIIEQNYQGQNKISYDELEATVRANIMPLERIFTSSYASYGMYKLGDGNYGEANTIILNSPIEHGVTGHFPGDFKASGRKNIKYVTKQLNDNTWVAVEQGYESQGANENNIYQFVGTAGTKEAVEGWIKNYENLQSKWVVYTDRINENGEQEGEIVQGFDTEAEAESFWRQNTESYKNKGFTLDYNLSSEYSRSEINKGMFAHIRVWQDGDTFYVAEAQSDFMQKYKAKNELIKGKPQYYSTEEFSKKREEFFIKQGFTPDNSREKKPSILNLVELKIENNKEIGKYERALFTSKNNTDFNQLMIKIKELEIKNEAIDDYLPNGRMNVFDFVKKYNNNQKEVDAFIKDEKLREQKHIDNIFTPQEKQFIASQKEWEKRLLREALKEASLSGATTFRLPTPYTLSVIEGYITAEKGVPKLPYNIISAYNSDVLVEGDIINYLNRDKIVYNVTDNSIKIVDTSNDITDEIISDIQIEKDSDVFIKENKLSDKKLPYKGVSLPNGKVLFTETTEIAESVDEDNLSSLFAEETVSDYFNRFKKQIEEFLGEKFTKKEWEELVEDSDVILQKRPHTSLEDATNIFNGDIPTINYRPTTEEIKEVAEIFSKTNNFDFVIINGKVIEITNSETLQQPSAYKEKQKDTFEIADLSDTQQTVARKYEELYNLLQQERGAENVEIITDENGFDWYETKLSPEEVNKPVVAFSQQQAGITIEEAIKRNNGNPLNLAPNGKPSILYKSYQDSGYEGAELDALVSQVYSDEFLGWFGDWINDPQNSSKVVDENGQPLILFHGTVDDFTVFETAPTNMKETRGGAFFGNRETASYFDGGGSGQIMPVFIKGTNPYIDSNVPNQLPATKGYWATDYFDNNLEEVYKKSQNSDSIFLQNSEDNSIFVNVFDPTQIKSATENIGTFDATNPDIRFQKELTLQETDYDLMIEDMIEKGEITQNCKL